MYGVILSTFFMIGSLMLTRIGPPPVLSKSVFASLRAFLHRVFTFSQHLEKENCIFKFNSHFFTPQGRSRLLNSPHSLTWVDWVGVIFFNFNGLWYGMLQWNFGENFGKILFWWNFGVVLMVLRPMLAMQLF